jgi:hypothetical protein
LLSVNRPPVVFKNVKKIHLFFTEQRRLKREKQGRGQRQ